MDMELYIDSVMSELSLPKSVRADVRQRLIEDILISRQREESLDAFIERRGSAKDVAREYNEAYRAGTNRKQRGLNAAIALLFLFLSLSIYLLGGHLFDYAKERVQYEQARLLFGQINPRQVQGGSQTAYAPFEGAGAAYDSYTPATPPFSFEIPDEPVFTSRLDAVTIVSYGAVMILCLIGINAGVSQKEELKKHRHYLRIIPDYAKKD